MNALELKFKKMGTTQLMGKVSKMVGEEKITTIAILKQRGQDVSKWESSEVKETEVLVNSGFVYEAEPEEELTKIEEKEIKKAIQSEVKFSKYIPKETSKSTEVKDSIKEIISFKVGETVITTQVIKTFKNRGIKYFKVLVDGKNKDVNEKNIIPSEVLVETQGE